MRSTTTIKEMNKEQLLKLIGALIQVNDSHLVDNKSCFLCPDDQHEYYKIIRDCFQKIYEEADFTQTNLFLNETKGKSEQFVEMKTKLYRKPLKISAHRNELIEKICSLKNIEETKNYINISNKQLYEEALHYIEKCHDA
jgi:hypothetical protein